MTLLAIASSIANKAMESEYLISVVKSNAADRAELPMIGFVYHSIEFNQWLYGHVDLDIRLTTFRLSNEEKANKIVAKRVVHIMRKKLMGFEKLAG